MPADDSPTAPRRANDGTTLTNEGTSPSVASGDVLVGRYEIAAEIGHGGFGRVYEALDRLLDRRVAVKVLAAAGSALPADRQRFLKEARASARLQHENVVALYDAGEDPKGLFLVFELVTGTSLKQRIATSALPSPEAASVVRQIASALSAAHSLGIIHRDVKPANVLLTPDGIVKVADFGIARLAGETQITAEGRLIGTPQYMAPEQIEGKAVTSKADLFSLGCLYYELLTGEPPFRGSLKEVLAQILAGEPTPLPADAPAPACGLLDRLLSKNPDERPTAAEVVSELSVPEREPGQREGTTPRLGKRGRRTAFALVTAIVIVASLYVARPRGEERLMKQLELTRLRATPAQLAFFERCLRQAGVADVELKRLDETEIEIAANADADALSNAASIIGFFDAMDGYRATVEPNLFGSRTPSNRLVSLELRNMPLGGALNALASAADWPIVHSPSIDSGDVTFSLVDVSWDRAVRTLLDANELDVLRYGDVWLLAERREISAFEELEDPEVVVKRPRRVSADTLQRALEPARSEDGVISVNPRLGAVVIADRRRAFTAYEKIYATVEGTDPELLDFPTSEFSEILFSPPPSLDIADYDYLPFPFATDYPMDELLRVFADITGLNIVFLAHLNASEERVSLSAQGVSWDNVLEVVLRSRRLFYTAEENIVRIVSPDQRGTEPVVESLSLRNEDPEFFLPFEKSLTPAGSLRIEPGSRTLIVEDVPWRAQWLLELARMIDAWEPALK